MHFILVILIAIIIWVGYRLQLHHLPRPWKYRAQVSGTPYYIAGSTSGSPLSDMGSHCGFKSVLEKKSAACTALHATVTSLGAGRLYDFAFLLYGEGGQLFFRSPESRKVKFYPYCIEEQVIDRGWELRTRLFFLQTNLAVLQAEVKDGGRDGEEVKSGRHSGRVQKVKPAFLLMPPGGRDVENPYPHLNGRTIIRRRGDGLLLTNLHRVPGLKMQAYFLPSSGGCSGRKELQGSWEKVKAGEKINWSVIISFSADLNGNIIEDAEAARGRMKSLVTGVEKRRREFEKTLPTPGAGWEQQEEDSRVFRLAAWALENNLYAPRGGMSRWGSLPSKVYFPFIWGWDTPQHVIAISEWNSRKAADILLTQLEGNCGKPAPDKLKIRVNGVTIFSGPQWNRVPSKIDDSLRGVLNFYAQPPLQSWAALRAYLHFACDDEACSFLQEVLPLLKRNLCWWEENRKLPHGLFSYLNGLESGLDDSPRFYPRSFLPSFIIGLMPRFLSAVDLNCWIYQSYLNLSCLCREAKQKGEAERYYYRAIELGEMIDRQLWSPPDSAWLDCRKGKMVRVFTPVIWWPAFLGAGRDIKKIKAVIENYLLHPGKFWGQHGIPSVSFDDSTHNYSKEGYYWRGQIWMINNYSALEILFRFGYTEESLTLHRRIIQVVTRSGGLYETYNAGSGQVGWSSRGPGDPAVLQFGMSSAWITQILLCRYQRFRYILPDTRQVYGYVQWADTWDKELLASPPTAGPVPDDALLQVRVNDTSPFKTPLLDMRSQDGEPLLRSRLIKIYLDHPVEGTLQDGKVELWWKGKNYTLRLRVEELIEL